MTNKKTIVIGLAAVAGLGLLLAEQKATAKGSPGSAPWPTVPVPSTPPSWWPTGLSFTAPPPNWPVGMGWPPGQQTSPKPLPVPAGWPSSYPWPGYWPPGIPFPPTAAQPASTVGPCALDANIPPAIAADVQAALASSQQMNPAAYDQFAAFLQQMGLPMAAACVLRRKTEGPIQVQLATR